MFPICIKCNFENLFNTGFQRRRNSTQAAASKSELDYLTGSLGQNQLIGERLRQENLLVVQDNLRLLSDKKQREAAVRAEEQ